MTKCFTLKMGAVYSSKMLITSIDCVPSGKQNEMTVGRGSPLTTVSTPAILWFVVVKDNL
jgi:hypothetical protein